MGSFVKSGHGHHGKERESHPLSFGYFAYQQEPKIVKRLKPDSQKSEAFTCRHVSVYFGQVSLKRTRWPRQLALLAFVFFL